MEILHIPQLKKWYATWWGIVLLVLGTFIFGVGLFIGVKVAFFYWQIKTKGLESANLEFAGKFTLGDITTSLGDASATSLADPASVLSKDDPSFGNPKAKLQIVVFSNFECPHSKEASSVVRELALKYKDQINVIYRDFPLDSIYKNSRIASEASECAAEQGMFWPFFDRLYAASPALDEESLKIYAAQSGLNQEVFNKCLGEAQMRKEVQADYEDGLKAGVRGTPTFFINGVKIEGAIPKNIFEQIIKRSLVN